MKAYSQDLRDRVVKSYIEDNIKPLEIAKRYKICKDSVYSWLNRFKATGDYSSKQQLNKGRASRFTNKQVIIDYIASNPDADGIAIRDAVAPNLPMTTFYDTLKRMEITYKKKSQNTSNGKKKNVKNLWSK